jgi:chromosome segregation ATPase
MAGAETIEVYEMRVAELKDELIKAQASNGSSSEADATLRLQLEAAREEIRAVQEAAALRETEMEARLREAKISGVSSNSQEMVIQLQADLEAALTERLRLAEQVATLKTQTRELKSSKNDLEQRIVEADQAIEQVRVSARHSISSMDDIMRDRDAELSILTKEKQTLEAEVKQLRQALENARHEPTDSEELTALREELEDLRVQLKDANNAKTLSSNATTNDDEAAQITDLQRRIDELTQENREAKQENQRLLEVQSSLAEAHRQVESECLKLMDELERLHSEQLSMPPVPSAPEVDAGIKLEEVPDDDPDNPMPPEQRRLLALLKEKQSALEAQQRAHQQEQRRLQQHISDMEREHRAEVEQRDKDITDLENLIESKIFREADLEERLEQQCQLVKQLQQQQSSSGYGNELIVGGAQSHGMNSRASSMGRAGTRSPSAASSRSRNRSATRDYSQVYCEICEEDGHDIMSCPAVMGTSAINGTKPPKSRATILEEDEAQFDRTVSIGSFAR